MVNNTFNASEYVYENFYWHFLIDKALWQTIKFFLCGAKCFWMCWFTAYIWREGVYMWVGDVNRQWERDKAEAEGGIIKMHINMKRFTNGFYLFIKMH